MDDQSKVNPLRQPADQVGVQPVSVGMDKEKEAPKKVEEPFQEVKEHEVPAEVQKHVLKTRENIELPSDLRKMGVSTPPAASSVSDVTTTSIKLPLTDDQIEEGLHAQILLSIRWLAEWCLRQLKKGHLHLKKMGGQIVRERD